MRYRYLVSDGVQYCSKPISAGPEHHSSNSRSFQVNCDAYIKPVQIHGGRSGRSELLGSLTGAGPLAPRTTPAFRRPQRSGYLLGPRLASPRPPFGGITGVIRGVVAGSRWGENRGVYPRKRGEGALPGPCRELYMRASHETDPPIRWTRHTHTPRKSCPY